MGPAEVQIQPTWTKNRLSGTLVISKTCRTMSRGNCTSRLIYGHVHPVSGK